MQKVFVFEFAPEATAKFFCQYLGRPPGGGTQFSDWKFLLNFIYIRREIFLAGICLE